MSTRRGERRISALALSGVLAVALAGCVGESTAKGKRRSKAAFHLRPSAVAIPVGGTSPLALELLDEAGAPSADTSRCGEWASLDTTRVRVEREGGRTLVRAVSPGFALVSARCSVRTATASVTVMPDGGVGMQPAYGTYIGGAQDDQIRDLAIDRDGGVVMVGLTRSPDFPVTAGVLDSTFAGGGSHPADAFIAKLDAKGELVWSTLLGGPEYDRANAVEIDARGFIYVAGHAGRDFPVTAGAFQTAFAGGAESGNFGDQDGFVCKIQPDGRKAVWCSYFGTADGSVVQDLAIDARGDVYIAAVVATDEFPSAWFARAAQKARKGAHDGIVAKIATDGSRVLWATYLGGSGEEGDTPTLRVGHDQTVSVLYETASADMPTASGFDTSLGGTLDLWVGKLSADGSSFLIGSYLGGSGIEESWAQGLALGANGEITVAAITGSNDFPVTPGAWQREGMRTPETARLKEQTTFVVRIAADGSRLLAATFLGGTRGNWAEGVTVDRAGNVYVTGGTNSRDYPLTTPEQIGPKSDFVVVVMPPDLSRLLFSYRIGGSDEEMGRAAVLDGTGNLYLAVHTKSPTLPTINGWRSKSAGWFDAAMMKMVPAK